MIPYKQLSLADFFSDCQDKFHNDKYSFLALLDQAIDLDEIVPSSFITHFHALTGRPRKHQLYPLLRALILQRLFSIPTDSLLIVFLKYSQELRDFCGFSVVPDASKFTRFKQDFLDDLQTMFDLLVDLTEPICQRIDPDKVSMLLFDTIEIYKYLLGKETSFEKAYIPLNGQLAIKKADCPLNEDGIPCCPRDPSLPMKREGSKSHLRCGLPTMKFVCPKMKWETDKATGRSKRV